MQRLTRHVRPAASSILRRRLTRLLSSSSPSSPSSPPPSTWKVDNPYTGEIHCEVPLHPASALPHLLSASASAQRSWATSPLPTRQSLVLAFADALLSHKRRIAEDVTACMGKPLTQALGEVDTCVARARSLAQQAPHALRSIDLPPHPSNPSLHRRVTKEPVGPVLSLCPWNYPLLCAVNSVVPALLSGCSALLKHSDRTPLVAEAFSSLFQQAGAPAHLVQHLHIDHAQVAELVRSPLIKYVQFTGSVNGGRAVYAAVAASRFIDVGLELGGKDAAYVMDDADLDSVVANVIEGALYNAGQSCCAVERVYLHRSIADAFISRAQEVVGKEWMVGDPMVSTTTLGPLAQPHQARRIAGRVRDAVLGGAQVLVGGEEVTHEGKGRGRFLSPTLVVGCREGMDLMEEETFGPVVACQVVEGDEEAVRLMNGGKYGLTASVWGKDVERVERVGRQLDVGTVYMNRCDVLDPELTWSGRRDSGKGFSLGELGFLPFVRAKSWNLKTKP